jgi:UDP-GlcNAc:undecaprenyl-phosphate/decaprenyl-phosphate GlcNAc-1-phosphate transferase
VIYLVVFIVAFVLALVLTYGVRAFALRRNILDIPSDRTLHEKAVPKAGGLAIFAACLAAVALFVRPDGLVGLLAAAALIVMIGYLDDIRGITPLGKLFGQVIAAAIVIGSGYTLRCLPQTINVPLTLLWLVGMSNAVNLLDGMDGLAAGVSAIAALFLAALAFLAGDSRSALIALALSGACAGFLKYNFYRASIFMGDTGSLFLGFMLAFLAITYTRHSYDYLHLLVPLIVLAIPLVDTAWAILRRLWQRRSVFDADTDHFYESLWKNKVLGYRTIVLLTYLAAVGCGLAALLLHGII